MVKISHQPSSTHAFLFVFHQNSFHSHEFVVIFSSCFENLPGLREIPQMKFLKVKTSSKNSPKRSLTYLSHLFVFYRLITVGKVVWMKFKGVKMWVKAKNMKIFLLRTIRYVFHSTFQAKPAAAATHLRRCWLNWSFRSWLRHFWVELSLGLSLS